MFINVVLSADNAVVIGMAAMGLAAKDRLRVLCLGIALATLLRIGFAVVATSLLKVLGLLLAGGVLLLWVAWRLWRELRRTAEPGAAAVAAAAMRPRRSAVRCGRSSSPMCRCRSTMCSAVAGVALDHPAIMAAGLAISVLLMGAAAAAVARLLERFRWIAYVGLAVVLYIAIKMIWRGALDVAAVGRCEAMPPHVPSRRHASTSSPSISGSAIHAGSSVSEAMPVTTWSCRRSSPIQELPAAGRSGSVRRRSGTSGGAPAVPVPMKCTPPPDARTSLRSSVAVARRSASSGGLAAPAAA